MALVNVFRVDIDSDNNIATVNNLLNGNEIVHENTDRTTAYEHLNRFLMGNRNTMMEEDSDGSILVWIDNSVIR
jgi:hypothetical protein